MVLKVTINRGGSDRQSGAVAIEFALLFLLAFALFYGATVYAVTFLLSQTFESAAAEGTRAAMAVDRDTNGGTINGQTCDTYLSCAGEQARLAAEERLAFLPEVIRDRLQITPVAQGDALELRITYPNYNTSPPLPPIPVPVIGSLPPLPGELTAVSRVRL